MQLLYHSSQRGNAVSLQIPDDSITPLYTQYVLQGLGERGSMVKEGWAED